MRFGSSAIHLIASPRLGGFSFIFRSRNSSFRVFRNSRDPRFPINLSSSPTLNLSLSRSRECELNFLDGPAALSLYGRWCKKVSAEIDLRAYQPSFP